MTDIGVSTILELIHLHKDDDCFKEKMLLGADTLKRDILYIAFRIDPKYSRSPRLAADTVTYATTDGSEIHLDVNEEGLVFGVEFY